MMDVLQSSNNFSAPDVRSPRACVAAGGSDHWPGRPLSVALPDPGVSRRRMLRPMQQEAPAQRRRSQTEPWGCAGPCQAAPLSPQPW